MRIPIVVPDTCIVANTPTLALRRRAVQSYRSRGVWNGYMTMLMGRQGLFSHQ
ncbi:hypothetical protein A2U01_0072032, partial [Trifolium medium]|nr:hypothetical protein [Trifolium medium]